MQIKILVCIVWFLVGFVVSLRYRTHAAKMVIRYYPLDVLHILCKIQVAFLGVIFVMFIFLDHSEIPLKMRFYLLLMILMAFYLVFNWHKMGITALRDSRKTAILEILMSVYMSAYLLWELFLTVTKLREKHPKLAYLRPLLS